MRGKANRLRDMLHELRESPEEQLALLGSTDPHAIAQRFEMHWTSAYRILRGYPLLLPLLGIQTRKRRSRS